MPTCKDVSVLVSDAQDRHLTAREGLAVYLHLLICVACRNFARQLVLLRRAVKLYNDQPH